jgi:hypothetical protein
LEDITVKPAFIASLIVLSTAVGVQVIVRPADAAELATKNHIAAQHKAKKPRIAAPRSSGNVVTYDRDSKDPNVGWHNDGGMRVCTQDCDNPEIPGSGFTCRDVQVLGMTMRECDN